MPKRLRCLICASRTIRTFSYGVLWPLLRIPCSSLALSPGFWQNLVWFEDNPGQLSKVQMEVCTAADAMACPGGTNYTDCNYGFEGHVGHILLAVCVRLLCARRERQL